MVQGTQQISAKHSETSAKKSRGPAVLLPILFACCLLLPTLDFFLNLDHATLSNENREFSKFPQYNGILQIKDFMVGLENFFNDHFGFRKRLVRTCSHWKRLLFKEGSSTKVIAGNDGWFFLCDRGMIEHYTGMVTFTEENLKDWQKLLETRRNWIQKRGGKYVMVIPPDKQSVYQEHLPNWLAKRKGKGPTKLDQFLEYMRANSDVTVLDLRPSLLEGKKIMPIYFDSDGHWNFYGGFIGYQTLVDTVSKSFPDLAPLPFSSFTFTIQSNTVGGDLMRMMGDNSIREHFQIDSTPQPPLRSLAWSNCPSRFPKQWSRDRGPVMTFNPNATRKAVIFRDSFSIPLISYLGYHFREAIYIWQYNWDSAFLEREKPDIVIDEMLESYFYIEDPKKMLKNDNLASEDR